MKSFSSHLKTFIALVGIIGLAGTQARANMQPLPFSAQTTYFVFKLASSLRLSESQTAQCELSKAEWSRTSSVLVSHSFVFPQTSAAVRATVDEYVQTYQFMPLGEWEAGRSGSVGRTFTDPGIQDYRYAIDLYTRSEGDTAICVTVLGPR